MSAHLSLLVATIVAFLLIVGGIQLHAWLGRRREAAEFADFLRNPTKRGR